MEQDDLSAGGTNAPLFLQTAQRPDGGLDRGPGHLGDLAVGKREGGTEVFLELLQDMEDTRRNRRLRKAVRFGHMPDPLTTDREDLPRKHR